MDSYIEKGLAWAENATEQGFTYVRWDGSKEASECPICHNHSKDGSHYGGNCIWLASAYLHHGMEMSNVRCACDGLLGGSSSYTAVLALPHGPAQAFINSRLGYGRFRLIRSRRRGRLRESDLKRGDIIIYYRYGLFWHVAVYTGEGRIIDCSSETGGVTERSWKLPYPCRAALRYIGD